MNTDRLFNNLREEVRRIVPSDLDISSIAFEGPTVVIYTKDFDKFSENTAITRTLATELRKRVDIRPDPESLSESDLVEEKIRAKVPEEAEITDLFFDFDTGVVTIEAINPGAIVGKGGQLLNDIKKECGWNVKPVRSPPIPSKTISDVRGYLRYSREERARILERIGRKIARPTLEGGEQFVRMTALGGFRQVGRSCMLLQTKESRILIDCGLDPGSDATPYFNMPELQPLDGIDAVVITHAHMDHCGLLPVLFKFGYDGPVYCTPPTRDLMALLQLDSIKLMYGEAKKAPFEASHVRSEILHVIPIAYEKTTDISPDVRLTFYNAGHILGSSIAHFNIGNGFHNIAFTGDTKYEKSWLFNPANTRFIRLESMVIESTYGGRNDGGHAGHRGDDAHRRHAEDTRLPGRDDLGGHRHPHRLPGVPQQPAEDPDIPAEREPIPLTHIQEGGDRGHARGDLPLPGPLHRAGHQRHDDRRTGHGVLPRMG